MSKYWISVRGVKGDAFTGDVNLANPRYLKIPDNELPAPHHAIPRAQWVNEIVADLPVDNNGARRGDILFFIHGYNNQPPGTDQNHKDIVKNLAGRFDCRVISFDWPSQGIAAAYLLDRDDARLTAVALVNSGVRLLLAAFDVENCYTNIHVLAHSMGAFVVREALTHADDGAATSTVNWSVAQLVLIGGDVSQASMAESDARSSAMYSHCYRLTNYFNGNDAVLQVSNAKRIGLAPRVGRVGLVTDPPPFKGVNVNCTDYFHDTYGDVGLSPDSITRSHTWYFKDAAFYDDLAITLRGAVDHNAIPTRVLAATSHTQNLVAMAAPSRTATRRRRAASR